MTRFVRHAVTACVAAAFAIALAAPSQAQQGYGAYDYAPGPAGWSNAVDCTQSPASPNYVPCPNN